MISDNYVLIITTVTDTASDDVVRRLRSLEVPLKRINTEDLPFSQAFSFRPARDFMPGRLTLNGGPLGNPVAVWYRRIRTASQPIDMESGVYAFCVQESRAALLGSVMSLSTRWMSHPAQVWASEFKPFQLSMAAELGLRIPRTIISNDPDEVLNAFELFGRMIVKPARSGYVERDGQSLAIYTSEVLKEHLQEIESARWSPAIYQELVPKRFDVRVTIVGRRVFAAAIDSQRDPMATVDWRHTSDPFLPHYPISLPESLTNKLLEFMDALRLNFGAIDLIQTPDNDFVFLEVNPSGQWLWLDDKLQLGISDAIAQWLKDGHQ